MRLLTRQSGIVQSVAYASANVAGSLLSAVSLIILSRALGPSDFGAFSVAFSLTQITVRLVDLGFSVSLQRFIAKYYQTQVDAVAAAIFWMAKIKLGLAFLVIVAGLLLGPLIGQQVFGLTDPGFATLGITLASIIIFYEYFVLIHQSIHQFKIAAWLNAIQASIKFTFGLGIFFIAVLSPFDSYLWYGLFPLAAVIYGALKVPRKYLKPLPISTKISSELIRTAKFSYIAALAITVADQLDVLMVKSMLDEFQTGLFASASRITLLFSMFAISVGTVLNTRVARYKDSKDLSAFYTKSLAVAGIILLLTPLLVLIAKPLLLISAGSAYLPALGSVRLLLISSAITMATIPFIALFYSLDYPRYFMISGLIQIFILILGNYLFIPAYGIIGSAWAKIIMRSAVLAYTIIISRIHLPKQT